MLQRALPQLGPPSRVKRIAQQHKSRQRRVPSAHQKMQQRGVVQRRMTTLEKWDNAAKQQVGGVTAGSLIRPAGAVTQHPRELRELSLLETVWQEQPSIYIYSVAGCIKNGYTGGVLKMLGACRPCKKRNSGWWSHIALAALMHAPGTVLRATQRCHSAATCTQYASAMRVLRPVNDALGASPVWLAASQLFPTTGLLLA